jgi:hypothetical protein
MEPFMKKLSPLDFELIPLLNYLLVLESFCFSEVSSSFKIAFKRAVFPDPKRNKIIGVSFFLQVY